MKPHFFVLKRGKEIISSIAEFCERQKIKSAYFSAIGAASDVELAFYDMKKKKYLMKNFKDDLEITNMTGNVAILNNKLAVHAHAAFSGRDCKAVGGHVKKAIVSGTCEVLLLLLKGKLGRKFDDETGLNLIKD